MHLCPLAKILVSNPSMLDREADRYSIKVHIDRTRDDGKWTMSSKVWVDAGYDREDDMPLGNYRLTQLKDVVLADVWAAIEAKDAMISLINRCRDSAMPIEAAMCIANEDLQEDYGKGGGIGFHKFGDDEEEDHDDPQGLDDAFQHGRRDEDNTDWL